MNKEESKRVHFLKYIERILKANSYFDSVDIALSYLALYEQAEADTANLKEVDRIA